MAENINSNDLRHIDISTLTELLNDGYIKKADAWQELLNILKNEDDINNLNHFFFRNAGDYDSGSLIDYIQANADLKDDAFDTLLDKMRTNQNTSVWNESLNIAIRHFLNHIDANNSQEPIPGTGGNITYADILNADAGAKFKFTESEEFKNFVIPWKNIDSQNYLDVRDGDEIRAVIEDDSDLQFTHKQGSKWIRLIMPEYERYVEIEDLDRNFWVIGQVVSAISAYLFDDDNPIKTMIKNLLQEITELWENILYLWAALAVYNTKVYTDVHVEVCYVPNSEQYTHFKYDNFSQSNSWIDLCNLFSYKIQEYPESNLILIPIRRLKNYYHNYYKDELYPGIMFYDRNNPLNNSNTNGFRILSFKDTDDNETGRIRVSDCADILHGAKDNGDGTLDVLFPYSSIATTPELNSGLYYGAIRTIPIFNDDYWSYSVNEGFKLGGFRLECYDAISEAIAEEEAQTLVCQKALSISRININEETAASTTIDQRITYPLITSMTPASAIADLSGIKSIKSGYYLGELASNRASSKEITYSIKEVSVSMPPITSDDPGNSSHAAGKVFYQDIVNTKSQIRNKNVEILNQYYNKVDSHTDTQIKLLVGTRVFDVYKEDPGTDSKRKKTVVQATSKDGLGGYYSTNSSKSLYTRSQLKNNYDNCLYDEATETTLANDYSDINIVYKNDNIYRLPYAIYSKIEINKNNFIPNEISGNANAFSKNISTLLDRYNATKFTGAHGGRIDLGAQLIIPGIAKEVYDKYEGYRVLPNEVIYGESGNGQYLIWLEDETGKPKRHTWNDTTTMIYTKNGADIKEDNWCIVFIKTYGGYAPAGTLNDSSRYIPGINKVKGYKEANTSSTSGNFAPIVFSVHTHIFLPNSVYAKHTREYWKYDGAGTRSTMTHDSFSWDSSGKVSYINQSKFENIMQQINSGTYSLNDRWKSEYTQYVDNTRGTEDSVQHNFYKYPKTGQ